MSAVLESLKKHLAALGLTEAEAAVTADYIEKDVRQALQAAHIPRAEVSVFERGDKINVTVRCRDEASLREAGANVAKHLKGEEVPLTAPTFREVGDGVWEMGFEVSVVEPVH